METNHTGFFENKTLVANNNITLQDEHDDCMTKTLVKTVLISMFLLTVIPSVVLNFLLWVAYIFQRKIRSKPTLYMISLSLSDLLTAVTMGWMEVYYIWNYPHWSFGETGSMLENSFWCLSLVTPFVHISVMTFDRYKAVLSSVSYTATRKWKYEILKIIMMWVYSISVVILMWYHFLPAPGKEYQWNVKPEWYYPFLAIHIAIPLGICSAFYCLIIKYVRRQQKELARFQATLSAEINYAKSIAGIIICLFVVWIPVIGLEVIYAVKAYTCTVALLGVISVWFTITSGVINPLLFLSKHRAYRAAIISLFKSDAKNKDYRCNKSTLSLTQETIKQDRIITTTSFESEVTTCEMNATTCKTNHTTCETNKTSSKENETSCKTNQTTSKTVDNCSTNQAYIDNEWQV